MKKLKLTAVLLISVFLLSGCLGGEFGDDIFSGINEGTYQVTGEITNHQEDPIENVKVNINGNITYTDSNGVYSLEEVEGGNAYIEIESSDYQNIYSDENINSDVTMNFVMYENEEQKYEFIAEGILNDSDQGNIKNGSWFIERYEKKSFLPEIEYILENNDGESQAYNFAAYTGGVSSNGEEGFEFALELMELNSEQSYFVYGLSDDSMIKIAVIEINETTAETFENIFVEDPAVLRNNIEHEIENSEYIIHTVSGEVTDTPNN